MVNPSWNATVLAVTLIAVILLPVNHSESDEILNLYNEYYPRHQIRKTLNEHPSAIKYRNAQLKQEVVEPSAVTISPRYQDLEQSDQPLGPPLPNCFKDGNVFCTYTENYPHKELETILKTLPEKYQEFFAEDLLEHEINTRFEKQDGEPLCGCNKRIIYPQVGLTIDDHPAYIVNTANFTQGVEIEECTNLHAPCNMTKSFPNGSKPKCVQKYIFKKLLGYGKKGYIDRTLIRLPSCCQCVLYD